MAQANDPPAEGWLAKLDKKLHEKNVFTDLLEKAETKTGVRRLYLVFGLGVFLVIYLIIGYGSHILCNFVGFLYPAYASLKAIESTDKDDDTRWLTYWVVYASFMLIETFTDLFLYWIPLYSFLKCCFLIYCMAPTKWNGSITIYNKLLQPIVLRHQKKIDDTLDQMSGMATGMIGEVQKVASQVSQEAVNQAVGEASKRYVAPPADSSKRD